MGYPVTPGERLKRIRHSLGMSQDELATKMGYEKSSIGNAESGRTKLSSNLIVSLVKTFNVNVEYLLEGHGDMFIDNKSDEQLAQVLDEVLEAWIEAIQRVRAKVRYNNN